MKKVARTLRAHRDLILNYFRARKEFSSGVRAVNLVGGRRMSFTEFSIEVVQRDDARQITAADARIPAWVPVYPRWKPENVSAREGGPERFLSFTFTTGDNAQTILSWYQERLRQAGFASTWTL